MTPPTQQLPAQEQRVETGIVRFGDDWPGIFIRGDNALGYALQIRQYLQHGNSNIFAEIALGCLASLLEGCDMRPPAAPPTGETK